MDTETLEPRFDPLKEEDRKPLWLELREQNHKYKMSIEEMEAHFDALKEQGLIPSWCEIEEIRIHHGRVRRCYVKDTRTDRIAFYWDGNGLCYSWGNDMRFPHYDVHHDAEG